MPRAHAAVIAGFLLLVACAAAPAYALDTVRVRPDAAAIDLTDAIEVQPASAGAPGRVLISTAPEIGRGARRMEVHARPGSPGLALFALDNGSDEQLERLLVVPHYRMVGSGVVRPDLERTRIDGIIPSSGLRPAREEDAGADVFRLVLDPGTVTTFAAELHADVLPQAYLWEPDAYQERRAGVALYRGVLLGAAGLLALLLTILFVARGGRALAAGAALGCAVAGYVAMDVGVLGRVLDLSDAATQIWRASSEAMLVTALSACLFAGLDRPELRDRRVGAGCLGGLALMCALALFDPSLASGLARLALALLALAGLALLVRAAFVPVRGALALMPNWFLLNAWVLAAGLAVAGALRGDGVAPALLGALVLVAALLGLTMIVTART